MPATDPILVIDDDPEVQLYLQLALAPLGRPVLVAEALPDIPLAAALVDLLLGDAEGLPLLLALRARGVPVAAISGLGPEAPQVRAAAEAGAVILAKPFGLAELRTVVRDLIARGADPS